MGLSTTEESRWLHQAMRRPAGVPREVVPEMERPARSKRQPAEAHSIFLLNLLITFA